MSCAVAASSVSAITNCSAQPGNPQAICRARSTRNVRPVCETALAPASRATNSIWSFWAGVYFNTFCRMRMAASRTRKNPLRCKYAPSTHRLACVVLVVFLQTLLERAELRPCEQVVDVLDILEWLGVLLGDARPRDLAAHERGRDDDRLARVAERQEDPRLALAQVVAPELDLGKQVVVEGARLLARHLPADRLGGRRVDAVRRDAQLRPNAEDPSPLFGL